MVQELDLLDLRKVTCPRLKSLSMILMGGKLGTFGEASLSLRKSYSKGSLKGRLKCETNVKIIQN
jgi:hypothetical protein